ncbi:hypothetical protein Tco_0201244 [Tanacetum coccineum]
MHTHEGIDDFKHLAGVDTADTWRDYRALYWTVGVTFPRYEIVMRRDDFRRMSRRRELFTDIIHSTRVPKRTSTGAVHVNHTFQIRIFPTVEEVGSSVGRRQGEEDCVGRLAAAEWSGHERGTKKRRKAVNQVGRVDDRPSHGWVVDRRGRVRFRCVTGKLRGVRVDDLASAEVSKETANEES